ncbi:MAG: hemolysin family protein [Dichotomicrobium sp.]
MNDTSHASGNSNGTPPHAEDDTAGNGTNFISQFAQRLGFDSDENLRTRLERALKGETREAQAFDRQERTWLLNTLHFSALRVEDVMVPRADIVAIDESAPLSDLIALFREAGHSRMPVYRETLDAPTGMIHIKDLLTWIAAQAETAAEGEAGEGRQTALDLGAVDLSQPIVSSLLVRDVLYVPPSMPVVSLLLRMQSQPVHIAIVVDEYGGTDGLVTIENLIEEIVGDIEDEHDTNGDVEIRETADGLLASARTPIEDLAERLGGVELVAPEHEDEVDTLGGLVFTLLGRVPLRGELIPHPSGIEFEVLEADPRRIKKLKVHLGKSGEARRARRVADAPQTTDNASTDAESDA